MLDMVAYLEARVGAVALAPIAGLPDTHVTVLGDNITVPAQCNKILGVCALNEATVGSIITEIQLSSPSLRATSLLDVDSWNANGAVVAATQIPNNPPNYMDFKEAPIELQPGEAMQALSAVDVVPAGETDTVVVILTDGILAQPFLGRIETVIADAAAAAVINVWSPTAVVFRQVLRAGTYALVGMKASGQSMTAARLVFGNQGPRPGVIAVNTAAGAGGVGTFGDAQEVANGLFRYGRLGVWGTFMHTNPPVVEVLCSVADAAIGMQFAFDVIKIA